MVIKLLGAADLLAAIVVILLHYDFLIGWRIGIFFASYLILKGWLLREDINSVMDILCGIYIVILVFGFSTFVSWIIAAYLFQKAVFSLG
ncbi:hypothetical protein HQ545_00225 [Candidatus Woesearchaeota archaeon]|nr:hypothetical protein [Candidatus Woesearchaeota archaeon]